MLRLNQLTLKRYKIKMHYLHPSPRGMLEVQPLLLKICATIEGKQVRVRVHNEVRKGVLSGEIIGELQHANLEEGIPYDLSVFSADPKATDLSRATADERGEINELLDLEWPQFRADYPDRCNKFSLGIPSDEVVSEGIEPVNTVMPQIFSVNLSP